MKQDSFYNPGDFQPNDSDSFVFTVIGSLITNYLPIVLCVTYLLTLTLPSVVSVYLFSVIRYGYLLHMAVKKPVEKVFDETEGNVFNQIFGIPKFVIKTVVNVLSEYYNLLTLLIILAYSYFNPLSLLVKAAFGPTISVYTFGAINSGLELAITALFVKMIYDGHPTSQKNRRHTSEPIISGLTGILLMGWLVHDEVICAMPFLMPFFAVFTMRMMEIFIATSCVYSFSCWMTDNLYRCFTKAPNFSQQGLVGSSPRKVEGHEFPVDKNVVIGRPSEEAKKEEEGTLMPTCEGQEGTPLMSVNG